MKDFEIGRKYSWVFNLTYFSGLPLSFIVFEQSYHSVNGKNNNNSDHSHPEKHKLMVFLVKCNWLLPFGSWPVHLFQHSWFPHSRYFRASPVVSSEEPACSAGDTRDGSLIPGLGRSSRVGNGSPPQHSCLGNPMDRGAWWATVPGVAKESEWLSYWKRTGPMRSL